MTRRAWAAVVFFAGFGEAEIEVPTVFCGRGGWGVGVPGADEPLEVSPISDIVHGTWPGADSECTYAAGQAWLRTAVAECARKQSQDSRAKRREEPRSKLNRFGEDWFFTLGRAYIWA